MEEKKIYRKILEDNYSGLLSSTPWFYSINELEDWCDKEVHDYSSWAIDEDYIIIINK